MPSLHFGSPIMAVRVRSALGRFLLVLARAARPQRLEPGARAPLGSGIRGGIA